MRASITASRLIRQVALAACLIFALTFVVFVASSASMRSAVAQDIHTVLSMSRAFVTKSSSLAPSAMATTRYGFCGSSLGPC